LKPQPTGPHESPEDDDDDDPPRGPAVANIESTRSGLSPPQVGQTIFGADSLLRTRRSKRLSQSGHWYS
jgi:hypothetical protein